MRFVPFVRVKSFGKKEPKTALMTSFTLLLLIIVKSKKRGQYLPILHDARTVTTLLLKAC